MRYPWGAIDGYRFETLAFDYARKKYPERTWRLLPQSGDGNRDVESSSRLLLPDRSVEIMAWIEAKYTRSVRRALSKGRLDPTLVSALIEPNVGYVLFISNGRFNDAYINRAERVFRLRQMLTTPQFVDGELLEKWLDRTPQIVRKFFPRKPASDRVQTRPDRDLAIRSCQIVALDDYRAAHIEKRRHLRLQEDYVLQVLASSSVGGEITAKLTGEGICPVADREFPATLLLRPGLTSIPLRFYVAHGAGRGKIVVTVSDQREEAVGEAEFSLAPAAVQIRSASQLAALQRIREILRRHQHVPLNQALLLVGAGAAGKTWVLSRVTSHLSLGIAVMHQTFEANSPAHNAQCVLRGLLFMTVGSAFEFDGAAEVISREIRTNDVSEDVLRMLLQGHHSREKATELLQVLVKGDFLGPLFTKCARGDPKVLIFDDVHKADEDAVMLIRRVLGDFAGARNKTLVLLAGRPELPATLAATVNESLAETIEIGPVTADDIEETLRTVVGERAAWISEPASAVISNVLELQTLAESLNAEASALEGMVETRFLLRCRELMKTATVSGLVEGLRIAIAQPALDLIFLTEGGVECGFIEKHFGWKVVEDLLASRLVTMALGAARMLQPKHDLVRDAYLSRRNVYSDKLRDLVDAYLRSAPDRRNDLLGRLCLCDRKWRARYLGEAIAARDTEIGRTRYGAARPLAEAVYQLAVDPQSAQPFSDVQRIEAIFAHGDCTMHTRSASKAVAIFREAIERADRCHPSTEITALRLNATAEIISQRFWMLDTRGLLKDTDAFLSELDRLPPTMAAHPRVREARLTALNRKMMVHYLHDQTATAEKVFSVGAELAETVDDRANLAHLVMDRGKSLCLQAPGEALGCFEQALAMYAALNDQERRRKVCASQTAFLRVLVQGNHPGELESGAEELFRSGYMPEYANALLEIAGVSMVEGRLERAEELLKQAGQIAAASESPRRSFLCAHLNGVLAALKGDVVSATRWHREHAGAVTNLGASYQSVAKHNLRPNRRTVAVWAHQGASDGWWVEPRLW